MKKVLATCVAMIVAGAWVVQADTKANWDKHCAKCHGEDGKAQTKMGQKLKIRDYTDPKVQAELKDDAMLKAIKDGYEQGGKKTMNGFDKKITEQEMKDLVTFIRKLKKS